MSRWRFEREGSWDYPQYGLGAVVTGDVIETDTRPDSYWTGVAGSTPVTKTPYTGYVADFVEIPEGSYYAYDTDTRQFVLVSPPSGTYGGVSAIP